ncbi:MAG: MATE family efflux transporter [Lachnospiraceae bacterium]|jgi:putative MATE family efflux protein|nr:MATE family efflux transporter [Lachnospiraceae bacterium]
MKIQLSDHFTTPRLLRFVFPSIIMMIFTSIYGVVDGLFVSNYVGKTPFAAVNLIMPFLMIMGTVGFMFGTGGSAVVSQALGEGKPDKANQYFSMMVYIVIGSGIVLTLVGLLFLRPIAVAFGASGEMLDNCVVYGRIILCTLTAFMLQNVFQSFLITAERPQLGLAVTVAAGVANMLLDFIFVAVFRWGIVGAAAATAASQLIGGVVPLMYFLRPNTSKLHLVKTKLNAHILGKTCINGSSELMTNISMSLVNILYNFQLMHYIGEDGVASYGIIMYVSFIFAAIFIGYSIGSAPIIGYHYGAGNHTELKGLFRKSLFLITLWNVILTALAILTAQSLAKIFVGYDIDLTGLTTRALALYSLSFLFMGHNIFGSAFFTALGNGVVSAAISFLRTLLFQVAAVLILPRLLGIDGIWLAIVVAELLALVITIYFFIKKKDNYHYL